MNSNSAPGGNILYPRHRHCHIPHFQTAAPTLYKQWQFSKTTLQRIANCVAGLDQNNPGIVCLALAGSYGRMDAAVVSDLDLIVIVEDDVIGNSEQQTLCINQVWKTLAPLGIEKPASFGIFMQPVSPAQLCDPNALGNLDYPRHVFGLRIQLLLDAQPIFMESRYRKLTNELLRWYVTAGDMHPLQTPSRYLVSDLIRYYRSYCVWHQFAHWRTSQESWALRQVKINHSRLISFTALLNSLCTAGESSEDLIRHISADLQLTPLERLHDAFSVSDCDEFSQLLNHYDRMLASLINAELRTSLINQSSTISFRVENPVFDQLINEARQLRSILTHYWLDRLNNWPESVASQLLF